MKQFVLTILCIICMCITILSAGIVICIEVPQITENLTRATALVDTANFTRDQLVLMANKTRAFVAGEIDKNEIYDTIKLLNQEAKTQYEQLEGNDFAAVPEEYSLDSNSLSHLSDVKSFFANIKIAFGICGFSSLIFCVLLVILCGRSALGRTLCWSGLIIILLLIGIGIWSIVDFNTMFNWLHSLFFANGSWLFGEKSLLISMYPTSFWALMGAICIAISTIISFVLLIIGKIIK